MHDDGGSGDDETCNWHFGNNTTSALKLCVKASQFPPRPHVTKPSELVG